MQIPVWTLDQRELLADLETPVSAFLKLRPLGARCLLETVERGAVLGRFSFVGLEPLLELEADRDRVRLTTADGRVFPIAATRDPLEVMRRALSLLRRADGQQPGDLLGGAIGYCAFEYVAALERVPVHEAAGGPSLARALFPRVLVTFDHLRRRLHVRAMRPSAAVSPLPDGGAPDALAQSVGAAIEHAAALARARPPDELEQVLVALDRPLAEQRTPSTTARRFAPVAEPAQSAYEERVRVAKEHIAAGDVFQVVLSQRLRGHLEVDPFTVAARMRRPDR